MNHILDFILSLAHKLRYVWAGLLCIVGFFYIAFHDFETAAHRSTNLHFSQTGTDSKSQNLFCESIEPEDREDDDSEPSGAHFSPFVFQPNVAFFIKKPLAFPHLIACFENEGIEAETPPPDCFATM